MNDIFASVWNPTLENKPLNHLERTFQTAFLESVISASSATAPLGSFGKSQKSVSVAVDNAVEARRLMEKLRGNPMANNLSGYEYQGEEVCGFKPVPAVRTDNTKISAYYFDMLMRVKDLLTAKLKGVINDADHSHYELLLYKIRKATEFE